MRDSGWTVSLAGQRYRHVSEESGPAGTSVYELRVCQENLQNFDYVQRAEDNFCRMACVRAHRRPWPYGSSDSPTDGIANATSHGATHPTANGAPDATANGTAHGTANSTTHPSSDGEGAATEARDPVKVHGNRDAEGQVRAAER
jgi:hypothetical protein